VFINISLQKQGNHLRPILSPSSVVGLSRSTNQFSFLERICLGAETLASFCYRTTYPEV